MATPPGDSSGATPRFEGCWPGRPRRERLDAISDFGSGLWPRGRAPGNIADSVNETNVTGFESIVKRIGDLPEALHGLQDLLLANLAMIAEIPAPTFDEGAARRGGAGAVRGDGVRRLLDR